MKILNSIFIWTYILLNIGTSHASTIHPYSACYIESKDLSYECMKELKKNRRKHTLENAKRCLSLQNQEIYDCIGDGKGVPSALKKTIKKYSYKKPSRMQKDLAHCFAKQLKSSSACD